MSVCFSVLFFFVVVVYNCCMPNIDFTAYAPVFAQLVVLLGHALVLFGGQLSASQKNKDNNIGEK